jgi:para-nitrobenzyl esterase
MDQAAALQWVVRNIESFGGDPTHITIAGESAGSLSVSALMASPLSKTLFQQAIGESGAFFPNPKDGGRFMKTRAETEEYGIKFAESLGAKSLAEMRAKPAIELLEAAAKCDNARDFTPNIDGYYLPESVQAIFAAGLQSHVPLLAGWNADEDKMSVLAAAKKTTAKTFEEQARARFGEDASLFLKLYPANTDEQAVTSAEALAGDDFIAYGTWKWIEMQRKTARATVYQYLFEQTPAYKPDAKMDGFPSAQAGARHAGEIEYVFETLKSSQPDTPWTDADVKVSEAMANYWTNFVKTGNPNGNGLPEWPESTSRNNFQVLHLSGTSIYAIPDSLRERYEFLDAHPAKTQMAQSAGKR